MLPRAFRIHLDVAACHEAGHAMAALWQGFRVLGVEVSLGRPGAGRTVIANPRPRNPFDPTRGPGAARAAWAHTVETTMRVARVALAEPLAEARLWTSRCAPFARRATWSAAGNWCGGSRPAGTRSPNSASCRRWTRIR